MKILYSFGDLFNRSSVVLSGVIEQLEERDVCHALILRRTSGNWDYWSIASRIVGIHVVRGVRGHLIVAPCQEGSIYLKDDDGERWEIIDAGPEMPSTLRHLTCSRVIGSHLYVAGMQRQVFRKRVPDGHWERADEGALVPRTSSEIYGFLSIDGIDEQHVYACGFLGQLWEQRNGLWEQADCPTNLKLTTVRWIDPATVYVVGSKGLILRGGKNKWDIVHQDLTISTFVWAEVFQETLFLATDRGVLYQLINGVLSKVEFDQPTAFHFLHQKDGILLVLGFRMAFTFDGKTWSKLQLPIFEHARET